MALTKEIKIGKITINEDREFRVRNVVIIKDNGKEISRGYSDELITPLDDVSAKHDKVKKLAGILHSKKTKDKYKQKIKKKGV